MEIVIYGVRGSHPMATTPAMKLGGNTTCVLIRLNSGYNIVFDGGTGIYDLGKDLLSDVAKVQSYQLDIILSHTHWDHIMGIPFFQPLHRPNVRATIHGPVYGAASLDQLLAGQQDPIHFPVDVHKMKAQIEFHEIQPGSEFQIAEAKIRTVQLNHPGKALSYRIEADGKVFTTMTDTAPIDNNILGVGMKSQFGTITKGYYDRFNQSLIDQAFEASLLLHDTHFLADDIDGREHWGHSTSDQALDRAIAAKVKRLLLFHHNPDYDDEGLVKMKAQLQTKADQHQIKLITAKEGLRIKL